MTKFALIPKKIFPIDFFPRPVPPPVYLIYFTFEETLFSAMPFGRYQFKFFGLSFVSKIEFRSGMLKGRIANPLMI